MKHYPAGRRAAVPERRRHTIGSKGDDRAAERRGVSPRNHVIQASEATTPLRQVYFVVQVMLMDPAAARSATELLHQLIDKALCAFETPEIKAGLNAIAGSVARSRHFEAMKSLRSLYPLEQLEMFPNGETVASRAA